MLTFFPGSFLLVLAAAADFFADVLLDFLGGATSSHSLSSSS